MWVYPKRTQGDADFYAACVTEAKNRSLQVKEILRRVTGCEEYLQGLCIDAMAHESDGMAVLQIDGLYSNGGESKYTGKVGSFTLYYSTETGLCMTVLTPQVFSVKTQPQQAKVYAVISKVMEHAQEIEWEFKVLMEEYLRRDLEPDLGKRYRG